MTRRERIHLRRRRVRIAAAVLGGAALIALVAFLATSLLTFRAWSATAASVAAVRPAGPVSTSILPFRYRGRTRFLSVPISAEELAAGDRLRTDTVFAQPALARDAYLRVLVSTQATSRVVRTVATQLRALRDEMGLDHDEYVELLTCAVQDFSYGTPRSAFELPVQALAARRGVCVDRSLLLAALLVGEGYDAGLWTLSSDNHVAVAVRGVGEGYRGSGYAFVETTRRAYVGEVPERYTSIAEWQSAPRLVVFGRGRAYGADVQTALIVDERRQAEQAARDLEEYGRYAAAAVGRWRETYAGEARRHLVAASLAAQLGGSVDDRSLAFATLETLRGWRTSPDGL